MSHASTWPLLANTMQNTYLPCTYPAYHELESVKITIITVITTIIIIITVIITVIIIIIIIIITVQINANLQQEHECWSWWHLTCVMYVHCWGLLVILSSGQRQHRQMVYACFLYSAMYQQACLDMLFLKTMSTFCKRPSMCFFTVYFKCTKTKSSLTLISPASDSRCSLDRTCNRDELQRTTSRCSFKLDCADSAAFTVKHSWMLKHLQTTLSIGVKSYIASWPAHACS